MIRHRELTYQERATWGQCPICQAEPGVACTDAAFNQKQGVHLGRLIRAPRTLEVEQPK